MIGQVKEIFACAIFFKHHDAHWIIDKNFDVYHGIITMNAAPQGFYYDEHVMDDNFSYDNMNFEIKTPPRSSYEEVENDIECIFWALNCSSDQEC